MPIILHLAKRPKQPWLVIHCSSAICIGNANDLLYSPFSRNERSPILAEIMCYRKILPLNYICGNNFVEHPKRNVFFWWSSAIFEVERSFKQNMRECGFPNSCSQIFNLNRHTHLYLLKSKCRTGCWNFFKSFKTFIYTEVIANQDVHRMELSYVFKC